MHFHLMPYSSHPSPFPGFLSTGDSEAPGNYALLDQVAALHWIRENIHDFGGDKNQVTLMGQGYGGAMVHLLLISPVTKGWSQQGNPHRRRKNRKGSYIPTPSLLVFPV